MLKLCFKTYNGRLITERLIGVGVESFGDQNRRLRSGVYSELPNGRANALIDGVGGHAHDPCDFFGVFMCVYKAQRFDLNGAKTSDRMSLFDAHVLRLTDSKLILQLLLTNFDAIFEISRRIMIYNHNNVSYLSACALFYVKISRG